MSFQKCPKCNGEGVYWPSSNYQYTGKISTGPAPCDVCLGEKIIHEEQGVPPSKVRTMVHFPVLKEEKDPDWTNPPPDMPCETKVSWYDTFFGGNTGIKP